MKGILHKRFIFILPFLAVCAAATAQNVDIDGLMNMKDKKALRFSGGVSASSTLYNASEMFGRQPFTYQFNGNLNISVYDLINIPLSFSLNNYGSQYTYPSLPNRLSLFGRIVERNARTRPLVGGNKSFRGFFRCDAEGE